MKDTRAREPSPWRVANALTLFRLVIAAPAMLLLALAGQREPFVWVLAASFASDFVDGTVARLCGGSTRFGAVLDSWADVAAYSAIAIGLALLWPELVRREWLACAALVASFVLPSVVGLARFGCFTSYHTRLVKLAVATTAAGLLVLLWAGQAWLFRLAAAVAALAALEEMVITCLLDAPRSNVRGMLSVWRERRTRV